MKTDGSEFDPADSTGPESKTSLDKLLGILMHFSTRSDPWSVESLSRELGLPHSSTYRYLKTLSSVGLVSAVSAGAYVLGPSIILLDRQMRLSDPLLKSAEKTKLRLASELPGPGAVLLCRLFRNSVMCVDSAEIGKLGFEVSYARGRGLPLFRGAASKVILANMPLRTVHAFFDSETEQFANAGLGRDWKTVKASLRKIRQTGYSITYGELDAGAIGVACPILDGGGQIVGSLGYVTVEGAPHAPLLNELCETVKTAAAEIQERLISSGA
jgi:DNA-binding IclR family transcriptional regulator